MGAEIRVVSRAGPHHLEASIDPDDVAVMHPGSSDAREATAFATSSVEPNRPSSVRLMSPSSRPDEQP